MFLESKKGQKLYFWGFFTGLRATDAASTYTLQQPGHHWHCCV